MSRRYEAGVPKRLIGVGAVRGIGALESITERAGRVGAAEGGVRVITGRGGAVAPVDANSATLETVSPGASVPAD